METSPERCLGGLMKDIDKEISPREKDFDSKDETAYKTSADQKFSLDSIFSFTSNSSLFWSFSEDSKFYPVNKCNSFSLTRNAILSAFHSQRNTILLQKSLKELNDDAINNIIKELSGTYSKIIKNKNGNYFCKDLFKICGKIQRIAVLTEIRNIISDYCIDEYATHPIQTLVELSKSEEEYQLILSSFNDCNKILTASLNPNGSYVIQKIIEHIPERYRKNFNLMFIKFLFILSLDMYGVCTVKKFIFFTKNELLLKQIFNIILTNFVNIAENQYGNYLIQYILENWWNTNEGLYLKKLIISKFHILASNHFSFYICDSFIKLANLEEKKILMASIIRDKTITLLTNNNNGSAIFNKLMNSLKNSKDGIKLKKNNISSMNNLSTIKPKNKEEKSEKKDKNEKVEKIEEEKNH